LAIPHYTSACLDADGKKDTPGCIYQAAPMDQSVGRYLEMGNTAFLYIFTTEVCLKVIGLGWGQFMVDRFNVFDFIIVVFGYLEFIPVTRLPGGNNIISAFRIFRLARVFKAAKYWPSMQAIIKTLMDTLPSLFYLTVVLCLLMFIAACSGMQLFGDVGIPNEYRANFGDFGTSMLTVFQILTGENWNEVMYVAVGHTSYGFCAFFIFTFIVGGFVILNLYLAILLSAFDCGEPPEFTLSWVTDLWQYFKKSFDKVKVRKESRGINTEMDAISVTAQRLTHYEFDPESAEQEKSTLSNEIASKEVERHVLHREKKTKLIRKALDDKSCGCISKHNRFRLRLARIVHTQRFDDLILILIIVSTLILAFESPKLTECGSKCELFVV
jgi:voltage-dependent calcium channel L type alpha-1F